MTAAQASRTFGLVPLSRAGGPSATRRGAHSKMNRILTLRASAEDTSARFYWQLLLCCLVRGPNELLRRVLLRQNPSSPLNLHRCWAPAHKFCWALHHPFCVCFVCSSCQRFPFGAGRAGLSASDSPVFLLWRPCLAKLGGRRRRCRLPCGRGLIGPNWTNNQPSLP